NPSGVLSQPVWTNALLLLSSLVVLLILRIRRPIRQTGASTAGDPQEQVLLHLKFIRLLGWVAFLCGSLLMPLVLGGGWTWLALLSGCLLLLRYGRLTAVKVLTCALCLVVVVFLSGFVAGLIGLIGLLLLVKSTAELFKSRRQCHLLWLLSAAVRSRRSLPVELRNHALVYRGAYAASLRQLAIELESGRPLGSALLVSREKTLEAEPAALNVFLRPFRWCLRLLSGPDTILPAWIAAAVCTAEKIGTLEECLSSTANRYLKAIRMGFSFNGVPGTAAYLMIYLMGLGAILSFLSVSIIPSYKRIFGEDFLLMLPGVTVAVNCVMEFVADYWIVAVLPAAWLFLLLLRYGLGDPLAWKDINVRWFTKWFRPLDAPDLLREFSAAIRAGQPLTEILAAVQQSHQRRYVRNQFKTIATAVEAGGDCWEQLTAAGFLRPVDVQCIRFADKAGNLSWVLNELAASRERTQMHRLLLLFRFVEPAVIIMLGVVCALIIVAFFMPMVDAIGALSR
ncbi:MAG: type II secretion system F family protein, partial [Planctomycetaceae bacterium]